MEIVSIKKHILGRNKDIQWIAIISLELSERLMNDCKIIFETNSYLTK